MATPPVLETPFTKMTYHWLTHQHGICKDFEMEYMYCAATVGMNRAKRECDKEYYDFLECAGRRKMKERYVVMFKERQRQKKPHPANPPPDIFP